MLISRRERKRCLTYCWLMWKHWPQEKVEPIHVKKYVTIALAGGVQEFMEELPPFVSHIERIKIERMMRVCHNAKI